jgi:hypothetical protein
MAKNFLFLNNGEHKTKIGKISANFVITKRHHLCSEEEIASQNINHGIFIHTYTYLPLTLYPEGVAEVSQILLRDTDVLPKLVSYEEHCKRDRW